MLGHERFWDTLGEVWIGEERLDELSRSFDFRSQGYESTLLSVRDNAKVFKLLCEVRQLVFTELVRRNTNLPRSKKGNSVLQPLDLKCK